MMYIADFEMFSKIFNNIDLDMSKFEKTWEDIKQEEKNETKITDSLNRIPHQLPALIKAEKIQKKAALVGFDWNNLDDILKKIHEEFKELLDECQSMNVKYIKEELGDVIFSLVNLARFLHIDSEEALNGTNQKFIDRFEFIEESALRLGKKIDDMSLEEMDKFWEEAKRNKINN